MPLRLLALALLCAPASAEPPMELEYSGWTVSTPHGYVLRPEEGGTHTWKREKPWDSLVEVKDEELRRDLILGRMNDCERHWGFYCRGADARVQGLSRSKHHGRPAWRYECSQGPKRSHMFAVQAEFGYCFIARTNPCRADVDAKVCDERRVALEKLVELLKPGASQGAPKPKPAKRKLRPVVR